MHRRRKSLSLVAVGLLAACSSASVGPNTDARTIRSLYDNGTAGIASRQDAIRRFGAPTRLEVTEVDATSRDSIVVVTHPGRLHRFLRSGVRRRDFLVEAQLSQPGATLPGPIRIGRTTRADLAALPAWDEETTTKTPVTGRVYWFNDFDYHGVDADPFFRYSIRVDGVFRPDFLEMLRAEHSAGGSEDRPSGREQSVET